HGGMRTAGGGKEVLYGCSPSISGSQTLTRRLAPSSICTPDQSIFGSVLRSSKSFSLYRRSWRASKFPVEAVQLRLVPLPSRSLNTIGPARRGLTWRTHSFSLPSADFIATALSNRVVV